MSPTIFSKTGALLQPFALKNPSLHPHLAGFWQLTFDVFLCNYMQDNTAKVEKIADEVIVYFKAKTIQKYKIYR